MEKIITVNQPVKFGNVLEEINQKVLIDLFYYYLEEDKEKVSLEYVFFKNKIIIFFCDQNNTTFHIFYDEQEFDNEVNTLTENIIKKEFIRKEYEINTLKENARLL